MIKMKIVLTPNPYRDKQFRTVQQAKKILEPFPSLELLIQKESICGTIRQEKDLIEEFYPVIS